LPRHPLPGQLAPGSKAQPRRPLLPWCRCCTWRRGRGCGGRGLPLHTLCRNWKRTERRALVTGDGVLLPSAAPPHSGPCYPPAAHGTPPDPPCRGSSPCQQEPQGSAGAPVCRTPASSLAASSSCRAQKLGCVRPAVQGANGAPPPHPGAIPVGPWRLPVAVRCRCCRGLGVSVGGIAPLRRGETASGRGAAPARGGSGGRGSRAPAGHCHRAAAGPHGKPVPVPPGTHRPHYHSPGAFTNINLKKLNFQRRECHLPDRFNEVSH